MVRSSEPSGYINPYADLKGAKLRPCRSIISDSSSLSQIKVTLKKAVISLLKRVVKFTQKIVKFAQKRAYIHAITPFFLLLTYPFSKMTS